MNGIIYCYKKKDENKIVYVGQTTNEEYRRYRHEKYDVYNITAKEYDYPLSRGIRKYGINNYEYIVLERDVPEEELIPKEQYYIEKYDTYNNGYNQTAGGKAPKYIYFTKENIELTKQMLKEGKSFKEINEITNISFEHISEINTGKRHHDINENYPLNNMTCGRKLTKEQVIDIIELLKNSNMSQSSIAEIFRVSQTTIGNINRGLRYKMDNICYPIRSKRCDSKL